MRISASSMMAFFKCPAAYRFGRIFASLTQKSSLTDGSHAHAIMTGEDPEGASAKAKAYAQTFRDACERFKFLLDPSLQEVNQLFTIFPGIELNRIIDGIATLPSGEQVLLDWKTTSDLKYWPKVVQAETPNGYGSVSPKASGFQAVSYLIPPPNDVMNSIGMTEWPTKIYFVVGTANGEMELHPYTLKDGDIEEFITAARLMRGAVEGNFLPAVRGDGCGVGGPMECDFVKVCYNVKNWEHYYRQKGTV